MRIIEYIKWHIAKWFIQYDTLYLPTDKYPEKGYPLDCPTCIGDKRIIAVTGNTHIIEYPEIDDVKDYSDINELHDHLQKGTYKKEEYVMQLFHARRMVTPEFFEDINININNILKQDLVKGLLRNTTEQDCIPIDPKSCRICVRIVVMIKKYKHMNLLYKIRLLKPYEKTFYEFSLYVRVGKKSK